MLIDGAGFQVLLVDDNPGDVRLTQEAFKDAKVHLEMHVAGDGVEAMEFLHRQGRFAESPRPDLILLDLNLPRMDGREVLAEIKSHPTLKLIPVVILTTSASDADIERSYLLHANCYISKPVDLEGFLTVVRSIDNFWLSVVKLPSGRDGMTSNPLRILLVEDNPGDVRLLQEMFSNEKAGSYELTHFPRLGLALNHLAKGGVDIVLLDLGLPDENGIDTVRRVRKLAPQVPLIVLTGRDDDAAVAESMLEGAQDYLVKGQIEQRALPRALRHAIERFRLLTKAALTNLELERRVQEKDILLSEIHHRVKNSLQVVSSLLSLESARIVDASVIEMLQSTQNRIRSMALIHQTLYQSKDFARVDFHAFLLSFAPTLIQSYSIEPSRITLNVHVAEVRLPIDAAIPCGLIVNELISNALKHAFPDGRKGAIWIDFAHDSNNHATLTVCDDGVGIPETFSFDTSETLGVQLVYLLTGQLGGTVELECRQPATFVMRFPLAL